MPRVYPVAWLAFAMIAAAPAWAQTPSPAAAPTPAPVAAPPRPRAPGTPVPNLAAQAALLEAQQSKAAELEQQLAQQKQDLEALRAQVTAASAQAGEQRIQRENNEAGLTARVTAAETRFDQDPRVKSKVSGLTLSGFVHADLGFRQSSEDEISPSTGDPLNEDRFTIRRARLRATFEDRYVAGALEIDGNTTRGATARLIGAEASLKLPTPEGIEVPLVMGTVGLFKIPFGFEVLESDRDRQFLERSAVIRALFPGEYDVGARVMGGWRSLRYALAVQNGEPIGERTYPTRDPNAAKDVTGRFGLQAAVFGSLAAAAGVSGLKGKGFHRGTPATKSTLTWQDRNEDGRFQSGEVVVVPGVSATAAQQYDRHAIGFDGRLTWAIPRLGDSRLYAEVVWANNLDRGVLLADPFGSSGRDLRELGYYAAFTQDVGSHLSLGVRYDYYNPDRDSTKLDRGQPVPEQFTYKTWALAAALRARSGRLIFEYDVNRNHLGRDAGGQPANLKDNAFLVRAEMKF